MLLLRLLLSAFDSLSWLSCHRLVLGLVSQSTFTFTNLLLFANVGYGLIVVMPERLCVRSHVALGNVFVLQLDSILLIIFWSGELLLVQVLVDSCLVVPMHALRASSDIWLPSMSRWPT